MMQYFLLSLRNEKIKTLTEELSKQNRVYYEHLIDTGVNFGL